MDTGVDHYISQPGSLLRALLNRKLLNLDIEATGLDFTNKYTTEIAVPEDAPPSDKRGAS